MGWLYSKVTSNKPEIRLVDLEEAKFYFLKYLNLTKNYELHNFKIEQKTEKPNAVAVLDTQSQFDSNLISAAYDRNEKIRRFKEQKELDKKLEAMSTLFTSKLDQIDDEYRRNCYTTYLKSWINRSIDDLKVINDEINILKTIDKEPQTRASNLVEKKVPPPTKPMIITRDMIQAQVFGAGYPSLPVYSIEEFYDQLATKGMTPMPSCGPTSADGI